uniref:tRNA/rRNA methyltransferase SpoU type domain-containing protein n=1 Tax=Chromera velia CCMP2878 TaxID=1169474 RepID=A0A0G4I5V2_9ALVE|eukprot:Cvel_83.t1-p1 / transcript=Cvel_83.t1 / gene=Cvel_83 / organism=Chromera_velia_CCMP2878 / gene_product=hypothetical protein / transcript_product=hypothetical protein / location=Cvel_scaffold6:251990-256047(-) / protein_length=311 / sequence_SO=supercontig / SO=protein_coding / is_pseudo=false
MGGAKLMKELAEKYRFKKVLTHGPLDSSLGLRFEDGGLERCSARIIRKCAGLESFDGGAAGTLALPAETALSELPDPRLVLVLDYIEDPGLMGTLLRSAVALQWQAVIFLPNCCDPFQPLALRASQGALFSIPHKFCTWEETKAFAEERKLQLACAHFRGAHVEGPESRQAFGVGGLHKGLALLVREEYLVRVPPPKAAMKLRIEHPADLPSFDMRSLDVGVSAGILMHSLRAVHFPHVSRSAFLASPSAPFVEPEKRTNKIPVKRPSATDTKGPTATDRGPEGTPRIRRRKSFTDREEGEEYLSLGRAHT